MPVSTSEAFWHEIICLQNNYLFTKVNSLGILTYTVICGTYIYLCDCTGLCVSGSVLVLYIDIVCKMC